MFRFFRRPPRDDFELDAEQAAPPDTSEDLAEGELGPSTGPPRRPLKTILAFGIVAIGLGSLYLSWGGGQRNDPAPPRLLPHGGPPLSQGNPASPSTPPASAPAPPASTDVAPPPDARARTTPPAERPTFYAPLSREPAPVASVPENGPYHVLAQASHEATVENLRSQIAELKLKKLKAELEAAELRKNPRRLFREEKASAESKKESSPLERLARVPPPLLPIPGPTPAERQAQEPATPPAPPQMRVRLVMLEPKEAVIETGYGDSRGWFTVREGQKFPDFVVTDIGQNGVTISLGGRGFFYPVGGSALGAPQDSRSSGPRQSSEPPRR